MIFFIVKLSLSSPNIPLVVQPEHLTLSGPFHINKTNSRQGIDNADEEEEDQMPLAPAALFKD